MDIIFIRGLCVRAIIGIYGWERSCLQQLVFDLDVGYDNDCVKVFSDCIHNYINYQDISDFVNMLVSQSYFFLLESVAESVARGVIFHFDVPWIRVKVTKFGAIGRYVGVGVIIERSKKDIL